MPGVDTNLNALIEHLYDAAVGVADWHTALESLSDLFNGSAAALGIVGPRSIGRIVQVGVDPACEARYLERHAGRNELAARSAVVPVGTVVTDRDLMPRAEFLRTAFYDECLRPHGLSTLMNLRAARGEGGAVANVCILRSAGQGDFGPEDVQLFESLAPHLRRAVAVHVRLAEAEGERRALSETLDRLSHAAFLVDAASVVRLANAAGAELLAKRDGLSADAGDGMALRAARGGETTALRRLIAAAVRGDGAGPPRAGRMRLPRPDKAPLMAAVVPLTAAGLAAAGLRPDAAALLLVTDPEAKARTPSPAVLREIFGLTPAEAEIAARAARGEGMPAAAEALGITQGTARLHLSRVFEKTGAHRQAELTALLSRMAP
jgi:DNA-binding CsgD family transcriptional regulator